MVAMNGVECLLLGCTVLFVTYVCLILDTTDLAAESVVVPAAVNSTKPKLPHRLIQLQVILPKTICQPMLIQLQLNQPKQLISQLIQQQLICS